MKKTILLIFMFIAMFFVGSNSALAAVKCKATDENCMEKLKNYVNGMGGSYELLCLYKVKVEDIWGNTPEYYNYIYYSYDYGNYWAGTTMGSRLMDQRLSQNSNAWLVGDAYSALFDNKQCPTHSYIEASGDNEVCFDNGDGECLNARDSFGITLETDKSNLIEENFDIIDYGDLGFGNVCDSSNLPVGYEYACRYTNSSTTDFVILLYNRNINNNVLIYGDTESRTLIPYNASVDRLTGATNGFITYDNYTNKIAETLSSCPDNIYLNKSAKIENSNNNIMNEYDYFSWNLTADELVREYKFKKCTGDVAELDPFKYSDCSELISGDLREIINDIMFVIRIAVPILLIGLVTYDFATAVFAGDDSKVNKVKQKAIKRIIIAVVIFFVPILLDFVFNIVNEVWGTNYGTCEIGK